MSAWHIVSRRGRGRHSKGEIHDLEQLACLLGILCQEGGEAVTLRGMEAGDGGGLLVAARTRRLTADRHSLSLKARPWPCKGVPPQGQWLQ